MANLENVEVKIPKKFDVVCIKNGKVCFVDHNSFNEYTISSQYQKVGIAAEVMGNQVFVIGDGESRKWAEVFLWKLSGYTLDGTDRTLTITAKGVSKEVAYNATTDAEFAEQVNEAIADTDFDGHSYTCYVRNSVVVLQHNTYTTYVAVTATGVSITQWVAPELIANSYMHRYNGQRSGDGSIINMDRALIYFHQDLSNTSFNPSTDITSLQRGYPICLPAYLGTSQYQSDHCMFLRNYYGDGEEGWLRFMEAQKVINPSGCGIMSERYRDGKEETYKLVGQTYIDADGNEKALYPAVEYCANYGYDAEGLEVGNWFLPTIEQVDLIAKDSIYPAKYENGASVPVARDEADTLNRMLYKIGFGAISNNTSLWSVSKNSTINAWSYGNYGFANSSYFLNSFLCVPCCLIDLRTLNS